MKMNIEELREVFSQNKPIYKNLSQFSKICFYLRYIGQYLSDIFPENFCTEQGRKLLFLPRSRFLDSRMRGNNSK
jgi:hypothetical protein